MRSVLGLCLAGLGLALAAPTAAVAQDTLVPSVGDAVSAVLVLDQERLFAESLFGKRLNLELESRGKALAEENRTIEAELRAEEQKLTDERPTLDPAEFRRRADAFDVKVQKIRDEQGQKGAALQSLSEENKATFFNQLGPILAELLRERGAAVLLDRRAVLISADAVDITSAAVARIDERIGDGASLESEGKTP